MTAYMDKMIGRLDREARRTGHPRQHAAPVPRRQRHGRRRDQPVQRRGLSRAARARPRSAGMHVPFIASWPAVMKQGRVNGDLISSTDFLPTICEAAGVPVPAERRWRQLPAAVARRKGHAARVALLLVFAAPERRPDGARVRLRPRLQALPHRRVLRSRRRSLREKAAHDRLAHRRQPPPPQENCRPRSTSSKTRAPPNSTASASKQRGAIAGWRAEEEEKEQVSRSHCPS